MREIIRAEAWKGFRELVEELGGDADDILAAARVDVASLAWPDRYLPVRAMIASLEIAADRLNRPDFGLLTGSRANVSVMGALSIAAVNSSTGREGLDVVARYIHIHNPALTASVTPIPRTTRDFATLGFQMRDPPPHGQFLERQIGSLHRGLRSLCGPAYRPIEIWFTGQPLSALPVYRKLLGVTPRFGMSEMGIVVERAVLDAYQPGRSAKLRELAETFLRSLGPPRDDSFTVRVSSMTRGLLYSGDCSPSQVARALGVHERTLQRRLRAEGTSFDIIKDTLRREIAEALLAQPNVALSHIAFTLNYADASAFSRSCRRWFGESPTAHRARLLAATIQPTPRTRRSKG